LLLPLTRSLANDLAALLQRIAKTSVQEIGNLLAELQAMRKKLRNEGRAHLNS